MKSLLLLPRPSPKGSKNDSKKRPSAEGFKRPSRSRNGLQNRPPNWSKNHKIRGPFFFWPLLGLTWVSLAPSWPLWVPSCPLPAPSWANLDHLGAKLGFPCALLALLGVSLAPFLPHLGKIRQIWACLEPFGAYLAHPGPSSGQLTASLCFYLAVVDWQQCSQRACALSARKWHLRDLQSLNNFAIGTTVSNSIARRCLFSKPCK